MVGWQASPTGCGLGAVPVPAHLSPHLARTGAVLLDLDQKTLPGVAHQVVEQMVITDQIRAEDRANVLRALLLKHRSAQGAVTCSPPAPLGSAPCPSVTGVQRAGRDLRAGLLSGHHHQP